MASVSLFVFFLLSYLVLLISAEKEEMYTHNCRPFPCGDLGMIGFPFANATHQDCGVAIVTCTEDRAMIQLVTDDLRKYELISFSRPRPNAYVLGIRNQTLSENLSSRTCKFITNSTIPAPRSPSISYQIRSPNRTFVKCDRAVRDFEPIELNGIKYCNDNYYLYGTHPSDGIPSGCAIIELPDNKFSDPYPPFVTDPPIVTAEFELLVHMPDDCSQCDEREGQCHVDLEKNIFCPKKGKKSKVLAIALATLSVAIGVLIVIGLSFRQKFRSILKNESLTHQNIETFLRNNGPFGIRRYSYSDIKKMTNLLKDKLGQGGYGSVYKGKLQDGSLVAIKVLKASIGNGEEFINEVASISRTSHVNIVTLRGFCFEGSKRALVYEFMPNGSLENFIFKKDSPSDHQL